MLWKKLIVPPRSWPLIAMTAPPSHTITNTISNRRVLSSAFVAAESTLKKITTCIYLRSEHKAEEEGSPQIPITDFLPFFSCIGYRLDWINNDSKLLPYSLEISFLKKKQGLLGNLTYDCFRNWFIECVHLRSIAGSYWSCSSRQLLVRWPKAVFVVIVRYFNSNWLVCSKFYVAS